MSFTARPALAEALQDRDVVGVAERVGIPVSMLHALVRGTAVAGSLLQERLSRVLHVEPDVLFQVHPDIARLNGGRRLTDPDVGGRVATLAVQNRHATAMSQGYPRDFPQDR